MPAKPWPWLQSVNENVIVPQPWGCSRPHIGRVEIRREIGLPVKIMAGRVTVLLVSASQKAFRVNPALTRPRFWACRQTRFADHFHACWVSSKLENRGRP